MEPVIRCYNLLAIRIPQREYLVHSSQRSIQFLSSRSTPRLHKDGDADASFHFCNSDKFYHDLEECEYAGPKVTTSHEGNIPNKDNHRDLKWIGVSKKLNDTQVQGSETILDVPRQM
ncbi:hypothetical protein Tco_0769152 [Tanacetum coccineum]|uniref:Uncharacterized protein n=1 Tax=Tanacetum coccineum TaxID=301880 RepID=A0ABQ4ZAC6_9ASTR